MSKELITKPQTALDLVSQDVAPPTVNTDARAYSRVGWWVVAAGFGGFLLWATLAPLDKGVPLSGSITKESNRKSVQNMSAGSVQEILVRDGDTVKAGQVVVRMNAVQAQSQAETARTQFITARATEARLLAERDGAARVAFPESLKELKNDPRVITAMALQEQLFTSRRTALQSELGAYDENIAGLKSQVKGLSDSRESKKVQMDILKEQLAGMRDLAKEGYVARNRLLDLERTYAQIAGSISEDIGNIGRSQRQIMETTLRRAQRVADYQKEVRTQLSDIQREAEGLENRLAGLDFELQAVDIKAPVDGIVVGLNIFTKGGVVPAGAHLMEIVPSADALVVEGQLPVNLVDKVHAGLPVDLIFAAFNTNTTPHIPGKITLVSADRTVDEKTGNAFYKVRAKVEPEGLKIIKEKKMDVQPGMPVEMFVKTGERTMMNYLLKPVMDRAHSALTEE
ncbi:HlyD family type I secretion periplasmic adaptor subunit [Pseudoduganella rhizocola]|uniref:HlyD family type I secretion periplasmic adaptor subunit n=1 Tax=Pseudoduganella rhizocola TaxID=3382643 RepID=UPI0038B5C0DF